MIHSVRLKHIFYLPFPHGLNKAQMVLLRQPPKEVPLRLALLSQSVVVVLSLKCPATPDTKFQQLFQKARPFLEISILYILAKHILISETSVGKLRPGLNFINVLQAAFSYEHRFGSFFNAHVTRKSCQNDARRKTLA